MLRRLEFALSGTWLLASTFSFAVPIFLPSEASTAANAIGAATAAMFLLSFPMGLFAVPLVYIARLAFWDRGDSIEAAYLNLMVFFAAGLFQWFWIVPKLWRKEPHVHASVGMKCDVVPVQLPERGRDDFGTFVQREQRTPLEKVIDED